jgi:hypothetical protein
MTAAAAPPSRPYTVDCHGQAFRIVAGRRVWLTPPPAERRLEMQLDAAALAGDGDCHG